MKLGGLLFHNDKKSPEDKYPDYRGEGTIDGSVEKVSLAIWLKKDKNGKTFLSLSVSPPKGTST